jgi:hypothetical protein
MTESQLFNKLFDPPLFFNWVEMFSSPSFQRDYGDMEFFNSLNLSLDEKRDLHKSYLAKNGFKESGGIQSRFGFIGERWAKSCLFAENTSIKWGDLVNSEDSVLVKLGYGSQSEIKTYCIQDSPKKTLDYYFSPTSPNSLLSQKNIRTFASAEVSSIFIILVQLVDEGFFSRKSGKPSALSEKYEEINRCFANSKKPNYDGLVGDAAAYLGAYAKVKNGVVQMDTLVKFI